MVFIASKSYHDPHANGIEVTSFLYESFGSHYPINQFAVFSANPL